jgi:hypothetical protein
MGIRNELLNTSSDYMQKEIRKSLKQDESKLSIREVALYYFYNDTQITRNNANEILKKHGHSSGEKLFQYYTHYSSPANRKGKTDPFTKKKMINKINRFNKVLKLLPEEKKGRAKDEIKILQNIFDSEFH